jgi:predicted metal-dependent phosphotriesterase family hydrolase
MGVSSVLVTHPEANFVGMTIEEMQEMVALGAMLEFNYASVTHVMPTPRTPASTAEAIRAVGAEHCIMATDGGQAICPPPVEMLRTFIGAMLENGISESEIRTMVYTNPRKALGVD